MAEGNIPKYMSGEDSGWLTTNSSAITGNVEYRKIGNVVQIVLEGIALTSTLTSSYVLIATIPVGYRPSKGYKFPLAPFNDFGMVGVFENGSVYIYKYGTDIPAGHLLYGGSMYLTNA